MKPRLLRRSELTDEIAAAALRRPASLEAKQEAVATLEEWGTEIPATVTEALATARAFLDAPSDETIAPVLEMPEAWRDAVLDDWLAFYKTHTK